MTLSINQSTQESNQRTHAPSFLIDKGILELFIFIVMVLVTLNICILIVTLVTSLINRELPPLKSSLLSLFISFTFLAFLFPHFGKEVIINNEFLTIRQLGQIKRKISLSEIQWIELRFISYPLNRHRKVKLIFLDTKGRRVYVTKSMDASLLTLKLTNLVNHYPELQNKLKAGNKHRHQSELLIEEISLAIKKTF